MKKLIFIPVLFFAFASCTNAKKEKEVVKATIEDNRIRLRSDTVNVVKMSDTMIINESTCRGCAYENSTNYEIKDSMELVKLLRVESNDGNSSNMAGGSISQYLIVVPVKTGVTTFKMYKSYGYARAESDSNNSDKAEPPGNSTSYQLEVRN